MATCFSYDVFLSFRGEDTRFTFTDHLYAALQQAGLRTFRDDDAMDRGRPLGPELKKAIRESAISIIVFSRNYASSKWCLNEVSTIIEEQERNSSKHEVVPVFYNVEPSDVRNQIGSFEEAFGGYDSIIEAETDEEKKIEWMEKVKAWRVSLRKVADLTGMVLAPNKHESKFIGKIVSEIKKKLNLKHLYIEGQLFGIKNYVAEIKSWLQDPSPEAVILLIHGMGGIGKTTISKCIFNSNYSEYDRSCFLADIQQTSNQPNGLLRLQTQLLSEISGKSQELIWNHSVGTVKVANALCNKKVLVILDDVSTRQQIIALLGQQQFHFHPGSKVIITTRHKELIHAFNVPPKDLAIEGLSHNDSIKLFSLNAFNRDHPIEPCISLSELLVHHCRGHPLALKVLGASLKGKTIDVWEDAMRKLEAVPNQEIQNVLQLSYDTLEDSKDKDLFLHIACFFVGKRQEFIVKLLKECDLYPVVGIKNLIDRSLIYIENGRVMMHQLIKEMGQEVVRQESPKEPGKRSRLWHHQDAFNVLKENEGTKKVEGFALDMRNIKEHNSTSIVTMGNGRKCSYEDVSGHTNIESFKIGAIEKMKNLMLLQLDYATFSGTYKKLPENLRFLRWHGFPLKSIPSVVPLQKLVVLDLRHSKLKQVWDGVKAIGSLKILNLSYSLELIKCPDFGGLPNLESLKLKGCIRLTHVCESIRYLKSLVLLDVSGCKSLKDIPCLPRSLVILKMSGCLNLECLREVQFLDICSLTSSLVHMDISHCNLSDNSFPKDWSNLFSLKYLNISSNHITSLPDCVKSLPSLEKLEIYWCAHLQSVLDVPKSVKFLSTCGDKSLEIVQPNRSGIFWAGGCDKLYAVEGFFKFESIKKVDRKVSRNLGLVSILENEMWSGFDTLNADTDAESIKVSYEFGIFSAFVLGGTLPCFRYKEAGPTISFRVPSHPNGSRVNGLNLCFKSTSSLEYPYFTIQVNNKTKALVWTYFPTCKKIREKGDDYNYVWLSVWRTGNLLDDGDEIFVSFNVERESIQKEGYQEGSYTIVHRDRIVEECCVNFVYDGDDDDDDDDDDEVLPVEDNQEQMNVEKKDTHISWTDRLRVEVSHYVHTGKHYHFVSMGATSNCMTYELVEWWGLRPYNMQC